LRTGEWLFALAILTGVVLMTGNGCSRPGDSAAILPGEVHGWTVVTPDGVYTGETLYEYINGGAEVYRALNVRRVIGRTYEKPEAPEIIVDLFDMGSPSDAYGAYRHDLRPGEPAGLGRESELTEGALAFWKGTYFVSILTLEETDASREAMLEIGRKIDAAIPDAGDPPELVLRLPKRGLLQEQIHYFHTHESLNVYLRLGEGNPLLLHEKTEGVVARYAPEPAGGGEIPPYSVLLVRYPSMEEAREGLAGLLETRLAGADERGVVEDDDGTWQAARLANGVLASVIGAPTREEAERTLSKVEGSEVEGRASHGRPEEDQPA
jgi:hypothetical protein